MILHHLFIFSVILAILPSTSLAQVSCDRVCKQQNGEIIVPYPFGFSDDCKIRLSCIETGEIRISGYSVLNLTNDHILINFPAECNRSFEDIRQLEKENYALTWRNGLLLRNCSDNLNECVIPTSMMESRFNLPTCESSNRNLSCYSEDNYDDDFNEFMNLSRLGKADCRVLYSSIIVDYDRNSSVRSLVSMGLHLQSLELGWWMKGDCDCDKKAICKYVSIGNQTVGYRCHCNEGYEGDGYVDGDGCRKVSTCNATKYMSGECGGTTRVAVLLGGMVAGAFLVSIIGLVCYCIRKRATLRNQTRATRLLAEATGSFNVPIYPYREIERATNGFSEKQKLGIGAYGTVYAGKLNNHDLVAIKRIRHIETHGINQVMNEIKLLSSVSHPNLVRLLGFCIEKGEQILVYEFMQNGTLSQHLQRERGKGLPWTVRLTIATETAHALAYLHSSINPPIYHRDVKSSNILLDYNYTSKVADFGLSRVGVPDESHISTAPQGTPGYVDPQYHQNFYLSDKSDVYSFGVVLVEIISALKVVDLSRSNTEVNLAALAVDKIGKGRVDELIDPLLEPNRDAWTLSSIHKVAELAFRCLAFHGDMRPSMTEVAHELDQIRLSGWAGEDDTNMITKGSFSVSSTCSSTYNESDKKGSQRVVVPHLIADCLTTDKEEVSSPISVQYTWLREQNSLSANSLLDNIIR